jgi:type IV secretion system protein VirB9
MNGTLVIAAALVAFAGQAFALQIPTSAKNGDPRVCNVVFNPDEITDVTVPAGNTVTLKFGPNERVAYVSVSDSAHLKFFVAEGSNGVWLKGSEAMPAQPVSIRTLRDDGTPRDYTLQWTALAVPSERPAGATIASAGPTPALGLTEVAVKPPRICYVIRYQYPADDAATNAAKWRASQAKARDNAAEIALHNAQATATRNVRYVAMGDLSLAPTEVFDDGNSTELHFPGNMRIPSIYTVSPDGKESVVGDLTTEDNGVVKLHGTMPIIRLRDGELVLCLFNRAYNPIGTEPGTGTTDPNTRRTVGASR